MPESIKKRGQKTHTSRHTPWIRGLLERLQSNHQVINSSTPLNSHAEFSPDTVKRRKGSRSQYNKGRSFLFSCGQIAEITILARMFKSELCDLQKVGFCVTCERTNQRTYQEGNLCTRVYFQGVYFFWFNFFQTNYLSPLSSPTLKSSWISPPVAFRATGTAFNSMGMPHIILCGMSYEIILHGKSSSMKNNVPPPS